jgi:hypothetical protein
MKFSDYLKEFEINDKLTHKKSNKEFILSSKEGNQYWLYPVGTNPNDKNAMIVSTDDLKNFFIKN